MLHINQYNMGVHLVAIITPHRAFEAPPELLGKFSPTSGSSSARVVAVPSLARLDHIFFATLMQIYCLLLRFFHSSSSLSAKKVS